MFVLRIYTVLLLLVIRYLLFVASESETEGYSNSVNFKNKNANNRLFWLTHTKRLILPKGTIVNLNPSFEMPIVNAANGGVASTVKLEFAVSFDLGKLGLTAESDPNISKIVPLFDLLLHSKKQHFATRFKRNNHEDVGTINATQFCNRRHKERLLVFDQLANILNSIGVKGKPCLLRALCECHEHNVSTTHGLMGELVMLLFSMEESASKTCDGGILADFMTAEENGRNDRCYKYYLGCNKSLFVWDTNYLPYAF